MKEIETIRRAMEKYVKANTLREVLTTGDAYGDATAPPIMAKVLAHIDNQQAEIERLKADAALSGAP